MLAMFSLFGTMTAAARLLPSQDPFYTSPAGIDSLAPGSIIKARPAPEVSSALNKQLAFNSGAYTFMYRTTDSRSLPTVAVGTLIVPALFANTSRLFSYQAAYDSASIDCSPSYQFGIPLSGIDEPITVETLILAGVLSKGWYVVTSDYEGLGASFTAGVMSGQATLDGIRAALASNASFPSKLSPKADVAMAGYSGGALATVWAAELQKTYFKDCSDSPHIIGVAAGGIPSNISRTYEMTDGTENEYLLPNSLLGLASQFPKFDAFIRRHLKPGQTNSTFFEAKSSCKTKALFQGRHINELFDSSIDLQTSKEYKAVVNSDGILGLHGHPIVPAYFWQGAKDEVVDVSQTDALVDKYCNEGSTIQYIRNPVTSHTQEAVAGITGAIGFLVDRFNGKPFQR